MVLAVFGFLGRQIYRKAPGSEEVENRRPGTPVAVEVSPVIKADILEEGNFTGTLHPFSSFSLAPKIPGRLEKILVHIGDRVEAGQLVAVLDDDEYRQQLSQAKAELEVARANLLDRKSTLKNAEREYERTAELREKKIASVSQLDAAESEFEAQQAKLKVATAQVAQSDAALKAAEVRLAYTQIRMPENNSEGYRVVGERFVDEGAMLAANTPIVSILDISSLIAVTHVIEKDYPKIRQGLEVFVSTDAFAGRSFAGSVVRIAPMLKEKSRQARVEIEIPNVERLLKPGMFVKIRIQFDAHRDATLVPIAAIVRRNGSQGVFLADLERKTARFVPVTVGIVDGRHAEVIDPAIRGSVVTLGHHLLQDGGTIILPDLSVSKSAEPEARKAPSADPGGAAGKQAP